MATTIEARREQFRSLINGDLGEGKRARITELQATLIDRELRDVTDDAPYLNKNIKHNRAVRLIPTIIVVAAIVLVAFVCAGIPVDQIPAKIATLFKHKIVAWKLAVGVGSLAITILGVSAIMYKAIHGRDPFLDAHGHDLKRGRGKFWGDDHWQRVILQGRGDLYSHQLIDTSTLKDGNGIAYSYFAKDEACASNSISFTCVITTPIYVGGTMVYNAIRAIVVPIFVLLVYVRERISACIYGEEHGYQFATTQGERKFSFTDIPKQFAISMWRVVRAPFYGLAYLLAHIYTWMDPVNGRKLVSNIERDWNDGTIRENSFWIAGGFQKGFKWEGGFGPKGLGTDGGYAPGCYQPGAILVFNAGIITSAKPMHEGYDLRAYTDQATIGQTRDYTVHSRLTEGQRGTDHSFTAEDQMMYASVQPIGEAQCREFSWDITEVTILPKTNESASPQFYRLKKGPPSLGARALDGCLSCTDVTPFICWIGCVVRPCTDSSRRQIDDGLYVMPAHSSEIYRFNENPAWWINEAIGDA
ncbi:MAG: hypothetical protein ACKVOH_05685 [Chlamydiales bacterium]